MELFKHHTHTHTCIRTHIYIYIYTYIKKFIQYIIHSFRSLSYDGLLHRVRSIASSFSFRNPIVSLRSLGSCLRLLPRLISIFSFYLSSNDVF